MTKLELTKLAVNIVVGSGTTKIVASIIKNNTTPETMADQVTMYAGTFVLGGVVADVSKDYTSAKIDSIANWYSANVKKN